MTEGNTPSSSTSERTPETSWKTECSYNKYDAQKTSQEILKNHTDLRSFLNGENLSSEWENIIKDYLLRDITSGNKREYYGLRKNASEADIQKARDEIFTKYQTTYYNTLIDSDKMRKFIKKENIETLLAGIVSQRNITPEEDQVLRSKLQNRPASDIQNLIQNPKKPSLFLQSHIGASPSIDIPHTISQILEKVKKEDANLYIQLTEEFNSFSHGEIDTISPIKIQKILSFASSTEDIKNLSLYGLGHVTSSQLYSLDEDIWKEKSGYNQITSSISDVERKKQILEELLASGPLINLANLSPEVQKKALLKFGATRISENMSETAENHTYMNSWEFDENYSEVGISHEDLFTKSGFIASLKKYAQTNTSYQLDIDSLSLLSSGNILEVSIQKNGKPLTGFFRIGDFPDNLTHTNRSGDTTPHLVEIQYLGDKESGIFEDQRSPQLFTLMKFFDFLSEGADGLRVIDESSQWDEYKMENKVKNIPSQSPSGMEKETFVNELKNLVSNSEKVNFQEGCVLQFKLNGESHHLSVTNFDEDSGIFSLEDGYEGMWNFNYEEFLRVLTEQVEVGLKIHFTHDTKLSQDSFLNILQSDSKTEKTFKNVRINGQEFSEKQDKIQRNISLIHGDKDSIWIKEQLSDGKIKVSIWKYKAGTPTDKNKGKAGKQSEWKGSKEITITWEKHLSYNSKHKKVGIDEFIEPELLEEKTEKEGFWKNIRGARLGSVMTMFSNIKEGPAEAWKREMDMNGRILAGQMAHSLNVNWNWLTTLKGNANSEVESKLKTLIDEVLDGAQSNERADICYKWATTYNMPDLHFIAALFGMMRFNGDPYAKGPFEKRRGDFFWYDQLRGKHPKDDPMFPVFYKQITNKNPDMKSNPKPWDTVRRAELLHAAFNHEGKRYPQFSNAFRMFEKWKDKGAADTWEWGANNLDNRNNYPARRKWMLGNIKDGKPGEMLGVMEKWYGYKYGRAAALEPLFTLIMSGRGAHTLIKNVKDLEGVFDESGYHDPGLICLQTPERIQMYQQAALTCAGLISKSAKEDLESILKTTFSGASGKNHEDNLKRIENFWEEHGNSMTDLMTMNRDPSMFLKENKNQDTEDFFEYVRGRMEEDGKGLGWNDKWMGNNAFRFEANEGFPMQMLMNTGLYLDQNVSTRFWNGQGKNETDGVWGELMKFMKSIPDLAQKSADRNKESHAVNKYALQLYRSIRDGHSNQGGAKGFLKTWEKDADKCPHWSISARAYGLIGDASEPTETNIISWIQSKTEEINGGGGEKTREIGNKAALKTAQIFESSRPKSHAQHVEIPDSPGRNPEHQDSDNLALPS